jgi:hypothetical protein
MKRQNTTLSGVGGVNLLAGYDQLLKLHKPVVSRGFFSNTRSHAVDQDQRYVAFGRYVVDDGSISSAVRKKLHISTLP